MSQIKAGLGSALPSGFASAKGRGGAYHEAGDNSYPSRIRKQVEVLESDPSLGVVSCHAPVADADCSEIRVNRPRIIDGFLNRLMEIGAFCHSEMSYRWEAYGKAGGYRAFFGYSSHNDLFFRLAKSTTIGVVPETLVVNRQRGGGTMSDPSKTRFARSFRDFAKFCARERRAGRLDPLDRYGPAAVFLRPSSTRLADRLARDAVRCVRAGNLTVGFEVARQAFREKPTARSVAAMILSCSPMLANPLGQPKAA